MINEEKITILDNNSSLNIRHNELVYLNDLLKQLSPFGEDKARVTYEKDGMYNKYNVYLIVEDKSINRQEVFEFARDFEKHAKTLLISIKHSTHLNW